LPMLQSQPILYILTIASATAGFVLTIHFLYNRNNIQSRLIGIYTLAVSVVTMEPAIPSLPVSFTMFSNSAITFASFLLGPSLFLYCKHRMKSLPWKNTEVLHFIPAFLVLTLVLIARAPATTHNSDDQEVIFYLIFIAQLFGYSIAAVSKVFNKNRGRNLKEQMEIAFLKPLTIGSLALFSYSFLGTIFPFAGKDMFTALIQIFLFIIIMVIALFNAQNLEDHSRIV
jgi:asparagine N-glycosylation enzyme membrane subunit Stt3